MKLKLIKTIGKFENKQQVEVATSMQSLDGRLFSVSRLMNTNDPMNSTLVYKTYDKDWKVDRFEELCKGEDPRTFILDNQPFVLSWTFNPQKKDLDLFVINLNTLAKTSLKLPSELKYAGKNWAPIPYKNTLCFIYALDPLVLLDCAPNGQLSIVNSSADIKELNEFSFCSVSKNFGLRCGSNARFNGDSIQVFSRTGSPGEHRIYYSEIKNY